MPGLELSPKQVEVMDAVFEGEITFHDDRDANGRRVRGTIKRLRELNLVEPDFWNNEWAPTRRACIFRNDGDI